MMDDDDTRAFEDMLGCLRFPETFTDAEREHWRDAFRRDPSVLDPVVSPEDLYRYIGETTGVMEETKEQFIRGLEHYCAGEITVHAVLVGLYAREIADVLPQATRDWDGCARLRDLILHVYWRFRTPADTTVH